MATKNLKRQIDEVDSEYEYESDSELDISSSSTYNPLIERKGTAKIRYTSIEGMINIKNTLEKRETLVLKDYSFLHDKTNHLSEIDAWERDVAIEEGQEIEFEDNNYQNENTIVDCVAEAIKVLTIEDEILITAQMQSGKTTCMLRFAQLIQHNKSELQEIGFKCQHIVIIICASSLEVKNHILKEVQSYSDIITVFHINEINRFLKKNNKNPGKYKNEIMHIAQSCIFFDESHAIPEQKQTIAKLRKKLGCVPKNFKRRFKGKIVNVSATGYELAELMPTIFMKPGNSYYGLVDMIEANKIKKSKDISEYKNVTDIPIVPDSYIIVRFIRNIKLHAKIKFHFRKYLRACGHEPTFVVYDQNHKDEINETYLNYKPEGIVVIFVKDRLRMGVSINTQHVSVMYDSSKNVHTHTTCQALVGRACGYGKADHGVIVYSDIQKIKEHIVWYESGTHPDHAKYITNGKVNKKHRQLVSEN